MIRSLDEADAWQCFIAGVDDIYLTVEELLVRPPWHAEAACRGQDPAVFFPALGRSVEPAKALCAACPVQTECLEAGMAEAHGIWGGLAPGPRSKSKA